MRLFDPGRFVNNEFVDVYLITLADSELLTLEDIKLQAEEVAALRRIHWAELATLVRSVDSTLVPFPEVYWPFFDKIMTARYPAATAVSS